MLFDFMENKEDSLRISQKNLLVEFSQAALVRQLSSSSPILQCWPNEKSLELNAIPPGIFGSAEIL